MPIRYLTDKLLSSVALIFASLVILILVSTPVVLAKNIPTAQMISRTSQSSGATFTKNMGQWPDSILFRASANGATMWFTKNGIWYQFFQRIEKAGPIATTVDPSMGSFDALPGMLDQERDSIETTMIKAEFVGSSDAVVVLGLDEQDYKCNYFIGNEPSKWRSDVPNYSAITMRGLYPGVNISFSSKEGRLQSQIVATSSTDLTQVKVEYRGATSISPELDGRVSVQTALGERSFNGILFAGELVSKSEQPISTASSSASPVSLVYSTYLGGSGGEGGYDIAVNGGGNAYVTGPTSSSNFPTLNPFQASHGGTYDVFITKLSSSGAGLIYSTYLGGSGSDYGYGIAVDEDGNVIFPQFR